MWPSFKTENPFEPPVFTKQDISLVSLVWGFTLGFGYFVVLHAVRLTRRVRRFSVFIMLIWLELTGSIIYGLVSILYVNSVIPNSFWIYFWILLAWILQLQCLVQIIVNRIGVLMYDPRQRRWLKIGMLVWIGFINLAVAIIWVPAQLQINSTYIRINHIFDRLEKCLYLVTDAALNWFFIRIVRKHLVAAGLSKYDRLVRFNMIIIWASLAMDAMIIGAMSLSNQFLYTIFHPLAYTVKLEIEMTMSNLIVQVALNSGIQIDEFGTNTTDLSRQLDSPIFRTTMNADAPVENVALHPITAEESRESDVQKAYVVGREISPELERRRVQNQNNQPTSDVV
ncbi:hypothetical protein K435DRAFT_481521 [Dendrothele bispora CBS 962.96]|uniref:Integral membrane protein n=1 Tax=Dendrothele bispora (strain CBS 962.96) TaxID=1314807 RepID=A0A4S8MV03_DENBC|nr:hypothetical protein K435DRAFT_481521 [Dendrothele bispora CBS 962.96]